MAQGDFIWNVGDDDIPRSGTLRRILGALSNRGSIDYIYVNYSIWYPSGPPKEIIKDSDIALLPSGSPDLSEVCIKKAEEIVRDDDNCFTNIYASIFSKDTAKAIFRYTRYLDDEPFSSLESIVPHALYVIDHLIGKEILYIGYPCIIASFRTHWSERYEIVYVMKWLPMLWERAVKNGAPKQYLKKQINKHMHYNVRVLLKSIVTKDFCERNNISIFLIIKRNWRFPKFYMLIFKMPVAYMMKKIDAKSVSVFFIFVFHDLMRESCQVFS